MSDAHSGLGSGHSMVYTAVDVGVAVLVLISAILATARGFTREILSLATWAGSAAIAAYMYFYHAGIAKQYFDNELVATDVLMVWLSRSGVFMRGLLVWLGGAGGIGGSQPPLRRSGSGARLDGLGLGLGLRIGLGGAIEHAGIPRHEGGAPEAYKHGGQETPQIAKSSPRRWCEERLQQELADICCHQRHQQAKSQCAYHVPGRCPLFESNCAIRQSQPGVQAGPQYSRDYSSNEGPPG